MTVVSHRLSIGFIGLLLVTAAIVSAQRPGTGHAEGTAEDVQPIDLAKMTLPLSAYGPEYAAFQTDSESLGFEPVADRDDREVNAYFATFFNASEEDLFGALVGSAAGLFNSPGDAATFVSDTVASLEDELGPDDEFTTFAVPGIDGAIGFQSTMSLPDFGLFFQVTGAIFPFDSLAGQVIFLRFDDSDIQSDAIAGATALRDRMKGVITGKVTDFPAPLPPDVNCDGSLDSIDASLVLQLGAALVDSLPCDALADANRDGSTNAIDASLILQYSAGLIDQLPV